MGEFLYQDGKTGKDVKVNADEWIEQHAPKNGILKLWWKAGGNIQDPPVFHSEGHGLRYLWAYKDGKRADGFSRSWYYNQHKCGVDKNNDYTSTNNGSPRFLANWKNGVMVGSRFFYHSNGLPYLEVHEPETKFGKRTVLRNSWSVDGVQQVIDGNGTIEVYEPIRIRTFKTYDDENLQKLDGHDLICETKFLSLWTLDGLNFEDKLYMKKDIDAGHDLDSMHEHFITDYFQSSHLPKVEQYNKFKNIPGKGFVKVLSKEVEDTIEKIWKKGMPTLEHGTHLEFQQYLSLFSFPNRFVRYRAEYKDGFKIKETWYTPIEQSELGEIYTSHKTREIEYNLDDTNSIKKDNMIRKDLWKEDMMAWRVY